jgi:hypothetical protein
MPSDTSFENFAKNTTHYLFPELKYVRVVVIATDLLKILFYKGVLWPTGSNEVKVKILYTDGVAYMLKAGKNLKVFYPIYCTLLSLHMG